METRIRELLRERADEVRPEGRIPPGVLRRARRRRAVNATVAGALTVALAFGAVVGARAWLGRAEPRLTPSTEGETPTPLRYAGIYPPSAGQLEAVQEALVEGHQPWWTDPGEVARTWAVDILAADPSEVEVDVRGDDPVTAVVALPERSRAAGADSDLRTLVTLEKHGDVYVVIRTDAEALTIDGISDSPEGTVRVEGRLSSFIPDSFVEGTLQDGEGKEVASASDFFDNDGRFELEFGPAASSEIVTVILNDGNDGNLAATSFRAFAGASEPSPAEGEELPAAVESTRAAIADAATARDWDALRALVPSAGFSYTFGLADDPIRYWQDLEADGRPVMDTLAGLLEGPWEHSREQGRRLFIWPAIATRTADEWTAEDRAWLAANATGREIRTYEQFGAYIGYRVGIDDEGRWLFFIAGD
jgi:hypothetical protein